MNHHNSQQRKLLDSTAVAENRIAGGVGEKTGAIPFSRPDPINYFTFNHTLLSFWS